jgi:hypothetical protein
MRLQAAQWQDLTTALDVTMQTFGALGLDPASPDDVVWRYCQAHGYYLLTSSEGTSTSLPVFTLPMPDRVYYSPAFRERVVAKLLDYVLYADNIRGAGRLYLP